MDEYSRDPSKNNKMYTIYLLNNKLKSIARTSVIYNGLRLKEDNMENCEKALQILKNEFLINFKSDQAQKDVEYMINTYA